MISLHGGTSVLPFDVSSPGCRDRHSLTHKPVCQKYLSRIYCKRNDRFALRLSIFTFSEGTGDDAPKSYTEAIMVLTPAQKSQLTRYDLLRRFASAAARFRSMRSRCAGDSAGASTASINPAEPIP